MSDFEATIVYVILAAVLALNIGILIWAYILDRRAEAADQMRDALTLGADAAPLIPFDPRRPFYGGGLGEWHLVEPVPFDADREIEPPPDAVTELP
jgi:hypothetical protein